MADNKELSRRQFIQRSALLGGKPVTDKLNEAVCQY